jgi:hypothetical protein
VIADIAPRRVTLRTVKVEGRRLGIVKADRSTDFNATRSISRTSACGAVQSTDAKDEQSEYQDVVAIQPSGSVAYFACGNCCAPRLGWQRLDQWPSEISLEIARDVFEINKIGVTKTARSQMIKS